MSWTREQFLAILQTPIGIKIQDDSEISSYTGQWPEKHRMLNIAALIHANGITEKSEPAASLKLLQLVAAFGTKNLDRIKELVEQGVSVGARLDYMLPLYDIHYGAGEDLFVTSTKVMLGGDKDTEVDLQPGRMQHEVGSSKGNPYSRKELDEIANYVNNSFEIQEILHNAPVKTVIQPTPQAVFFMIQNAKTYRDSNMNPTIVFIPGAISIQGLPVTNLIYLAIKYGGYVDDIGFFGVSGLVWSIILADVEAVKCFLTADASTTNMPDEMHNNSLTAWIDSTREAMDGNEEYCERLDEIARVINMHEELTRLRVLLHQDNNNLNKVDSSQAASLSILRQHSHFRPPSPYYEPPGKAKQYNQRSAYFSKM